MPPKHDEKDQLRCWYKELTHPRKQQLTLWIIRQTARSEAVFLTQDKPRLWVREGHARVDELWISTRKLILHNSLSLRASCAWLTYKPLRSRRKSNWNPIYIPQTATKTKWKMFLISIAWRFEEFCVEDIRLSSSLRGNPIRGARNGVFQQIKSIHLAALGPARAAVASDKHSSTSMGSHFSKNSEVALWLAAELQFPVLFGGKPRALRNRGRANMIQSKTPGRCRWEKCRSPRARYQKAPRHHPAIHECPKKKAPLRAISECAKSRVNKTFKFLLPRLADCYFALTVTFIYILSPPPAWAERARLVKSRVTQCSVRASLSQSATN